MNLAAVPQGHCLSCNTVIFNDAELCALCEALPTGAHCDVEVCVVCRKTMPAAARRCNACGTYKKFPTLPIIKDFTSIISAPLALVAAILSVWFYFTSHTHMKLGRSKDATIYVKVWNTGKRPSTLEGYRLLFDALPKKQVTLDLIPSDGADAKSVIADGPPVVIGLKKRPNEELPLQTRQMEVTKTDIEPLPKWESRQHMTLIVEVRESSGKLHILQERFQSEPIASFIASTWGLVIPEENNEHP